MNLSNGTPEQKSYIRREIALGHGEIVKVTVLDVDEVGTEDVDGEQVPVYGEPYNKDFKFYVGKMNADQTGGIVSIMAVIFMQGAQRQTDTNRTDNAVFLDYLDGHHLKALVGTIIEEDMDFIDRYFDIAWILDVAGTFFQYNDFFGIIKMVMKALDRMGLTEMDAKTLLSGSEPSKKKLQTVLP